MCMFECPRNQGSVHACEDAARLRESLSPCWNSPQNPWCLGEELGQGIKLAMPSLAADAPARISSLEMLSLGLFLPLPP